MTPFYFLAPLIVVLAMAHTAAPARPTGPPGDASACMVLYSGRVQGVGFRATVAQIARTYPVTGWVKNLDDGRVQLLVEGTEKDVKEFLGAVRKAWVKNIDKEQVKERKPTGEHRNFSIRH